MFGTENAPKSGEDPFFRKTNVFGPKKCSKSGEDLFFRVPDFGDLGLASPVQK